MEADGVDWRGKDTGQLYYRVGLPELGLVVSWRTRMMSEWRGKECPAGAIGGKWRLLPVLGRLRTSGGTEPEARQQIPRDKREMLKQALVSIPKVEWQLAKAGALEAFILDFDDEHWRGHNDLMRYSVCCAQVIRRTPAEYDEPSLLMRDILGFQFILETIELTGFIPNVDEWVIFCARLSVHDLDLGLLPVFHLVVPGWLSLTRQPVAEAQAVAAAVKYMYNPTVSDLADFFAGTPLVALQLIVVTGFEPTWK